MKTSQKTEKQLKSISTAVYLVAASMVALLGFRIVAPQIVNPFLMALFVTAMLSPVTRWFRAKGMSKPLALVLTGLMLIAGASGVIYFTITALAVFVSSMNQYSQEIATVVNRAFSVPIPPLTTTSVQPLTSSIVTNFVSVIAGSFGSITTYFVLVPLLVIFMLLEEDTIISQLQRILGKENAALQRAGRIAGSVTKYALSRTQVNSLSGMLISLLYVVVGISNPLVWGFMAFMFSYIPYIGLVLASIPPVILAFFAYGLPSAVWTGLGIASIIFITENVLEPRITGKAQKLSGLTVFAALIFWSWLLGPIGTLLSVSLTVFAKFALADYRETAWVAAIMEGNYEQIPTLKQATTPKKKTWLQKVKFW